jgi:hypothetical protein
MALDKSDTSSHVRDALQHCPKTLSASMSKTKRHYGIDINSYLGVEFPQDRIDSPVSLSSTISIHRSTRVHQLTLISSPVPSPTTSEDTP